MSFNIVKVKTMCFYYRKRPDFYSLAINAMIYMYDELFFCFRLKLCIIMPIISNIIWLFFLKLDDVYRWNSYLSCKLEYPSLPVLNIKVIIAQGIIKTVSVSWKTIFQINSFLFIYSYLTNSDYLIFKTIINIWPIILLIIISISTHAGFMGKVR